MSLNSNLLSSSMEDVHDLGNDPSSPSSENDNEDDDMKRSVLDEKSTEKSLSERSVPTRSESSMSIHETIDYSSPLYFYYQAGQMQKDRQPVEPPLQIILPDGNVRLGYSVGHKMDECQDIIDGDIWLFRPHQFNPVHRLYYIRVSFSLITAIQICLILLVLFRNDLGIDFSLNYNGGQCGFVMVYYFVLLLSMIGCTVCVWKTRLSMLSIFSASLITDAIVSLIWNEHILQFTHWSLELINCGLLALFFSYSFGKWDFLQSQSRIEELERIQNAGQDQAV